MNEQQLYEAQYGDKRTSSRPPSLAKLRKYLSGIDLPRHDLVATLLGRGNRLLDLGCGDGVLLLKVKDRFSELYGVEISPSRVDKTTELLKTSPDADKFHIFAANINGRIDFNDQTFDAVACVATLEHLFDPYAAIREIYRILKPDGTVVVEVPNIAYIKYRIQLLLGHLPATSAMLDWRAAGWDGGHLHYFNKKMLTKLLHDCGFEVIKISGCGLAAMFRNWWPSLLTGDLCVKAIKR